MLERGYSRFGGDGEAIAPAPATMPQLEFLKAPLVDDGAERREIAAKFLEARIIKTGVECWQAIGRAESFEAWVKIGKALQIGRNHALKTTGANRPMGQTYCKAFGAWLAKCGFHGIEKTVRSAALDLVEHLAEIEAWRLTLSEKRRRQLKHPLSNVAAWRRATQSNGKCPQDLKRDAVAAWRRFCALTLALPSSERTSLWQAVQAELEAMRRAGNRSPVTIEWLSDNGSCYIAGDTRSFARDIGLEPRTTPIESPQSNGMAEAFVRTIKRDYVRVSSRPDAESVIRQLPSWIAHYNEVHPHKALGYRSPREFIAAYGRP